MASKRRNRKKKAGRQSQKKARRASEKRRDPLQEGGRLSVSQYEITSEPIYDRNYKRLPPEVRDQMDELYDLAMRNPRQAIPRLETLLEEHPNSPHLHNYLACAYSRIGDGERAEAIVVENYKQHPEYLFAKCNYAEICLQRGNIEEIPTIFDGKFDLKMLYPRRNRFHVTEVIGFMSVVGRYLYAIGEEQAAKTCYALLRRIARRHPLTKRLKRVLHPPLRVRFLKKLMEYGEAEP